MDLAIYFLVLQNTYVVIKGNNAHLHVYFLQSLKFLPILVVQVKKLSKF